MLNKPASDSHKTTQVEISVLFSHAKLYLDETPKAITPFGGLASFITFLGQIGYAQAVQRCLPFAAPTSPNAIPPAHTLTSFIFSVVAALHVGSRMTSTIKYHCVGIQNWTAIDENHAVGEFTAQLFGWSTARRFVVLRERVTEVKEALGRKLIDVPGYTFRVWVTNRSEGVLELWRDYNGRATIEQRIEELKNGLVPDAFCPKSFFATESAFLAVLLAGALLGTTGRDVVVRLSAAWGGLAKHKPLMETVLNCLKSASPKLVPPEARQTFGGGGI